VNLSKCSGTPESDPRKAASVLWQTWDLLTGRACSFVTDFQRPDRGSAVQFRLHAKEESQEKAAKKTPLIRIIRLVKVPKAVIDKATVKICVFPSLP
jgi:hypothetical protein